MNEVTISGTVYIAPKEMVRYVDEPRAAEVVVELEPVGDYGTNVVTVRCYDLDADHALLFQRGDKIEITGQLVGQPAHVQATSIKSA